MKFDIHCLQLSIITLFLVLFVSCGERIATNPLLDAYQGDYRFAAAWDVLPDTLFVDEEYAVFCTTGALFAILAEFDAEILTRLWRKPALPRQYRAFETFHLKIMPKAIQRDTSRFWVTIEIAANKHGLSSAFTVLKDAVTLDYANDSNGTADIDKYYNVKQIEARARKGNYYNEKLRDFLFVMANKEYVQKDVSLSDEMDGYYIYSDYTIKAKVKIRLDYNGDGERSLFDSNQESTGRMLIPIKGPFKIEKTNPKYEYV